MKILWEGRLLYAVLALLALAVFYGIYFAKVLAQKRCGIQTRQIGRRKEKSIHTVEVLMSIATLGAPIAQLLSTAFGWSHLPAGARFTGFCVGILGDAIFLLPVLCMKDSWRAGIPDKDKTELVTTGIYRFSRNPAFLGFDLMYVGCPAAVRKPADTRLFCLCHRHAPLADIAGGKIPCEHLWRAVSGVLPPCVPVFGQKIKTFSGGQIMSKRTRQYIGILAALAAYYLVHEGAHLLYALLSGVFKQINFMGLGVQIDVYAEHMTNMQLGIFCLVGALATFCVGYLLAALARSICHAKSKLLRAVLYYITIAFLLLDPLYLSILCGFFGGGDMNGIAFLCPEWAARCLFGALLLVNGLVFWKRILPVYRQSFSGR